MASIQAWVRNGTACGSRREAIDEVDSSWRPVCSPPKGKDSIDNDKRTNERSSDACTKRNLILYVTRPFTITLTQLWSESIQYNFIVLIHTHAQHDHDKRSSLRSDEDYLMTGCGVLQIGRISREKEIASGRASATFDKSVLVGRTLYCSAEP